MKVRESKKNGAVRVGRNVFDVLLSNTRRYGGREIRKTKERKGKENQRVHVRRALRASDAEVRSIPSIALTHTLHS
jgi:hypothetical protein